MTIDDKSPRATGNIVTGNILTGNVATGNIVKGSIAHAAIVRRPIPLRRPLGGLRGPVLVRNIRLLQLTADDGIVGIGEGSTVDWLGGAPVANVASLFRVLVDHIRSDKPSAEDLLLWSLDVSQPAAVRAALQTALLDVEARRRSCSLAALLGADDDEDPLPLSAILGDDEPAAMAREASALRTFGIECFKVKVGRANLVDDLARVSVVRKAIGDDAVLRLDANGAWDLGTAERAMHALASSRAAFVEEPLRDASEATLLASAFGAPARAPVRVAEVVDSSTQAALPFAAAAKRAVNDAATRREYAAAFPLRIALDESVRGSADLALAIQRGGFHTLVLKLERVGGPLPALAMAETATRAGLDVIFTDSIESAVGQAATLHTAAAAYRRAGIAPQPIGLGGLFVLDDTMDHRTSSRPEMVVKGPGLGIDIERIVGGRPS